MTNNLALLLGLINMFLIGMHLLGISTLRASTKMQVIGLGIFYTVVRLIYSADFVLNKGTEIVHPNFKTDFLKAYLSDP